MATLVFPTSHLSTPLKNRIYKSDARWLPTAPAKQAIAIEVFASVEREEIVVREIESQGERQLLHFVEVRPDFHWGVFQRRLVCGDVSLVVPKTEGVGGAVLGHMEFPEVDMISSGRPIRMLISGKVEQGTVPTFWELGGYHVL